MNKLLWAFILQALLVIYIYACVERLWVYVMIITYMFSYGIISMIELIESNEKTYSIALCNYVTLIYIYIFT